MDQDEQRDYAEEAYLANFCQACGAAPCTWDGTPDGFHTDEGDGYSWTVDTAVAQIRRDEEGPRADSAFNYLRTRPGAIFHLAPHAADGSPMRCCGVDAADLPDADMVTSDPAEVTCKG